MSKRSRSPEEVLDALDDSDVADEVDRVRGMSSADVDRELTASGEDAGTIGAGASEVFERAMRRRAEVLARRPKREPQRQRKSVRVWIGASAMAASIGLVAVAASNPALLGLRSRAWDTAAKARAVGERARTLRERASEACEKRLIVECEAALDEARALDPGGERSDEVRALRQRIGAAAGAHSNAPGADP
jgi:hypothetical protein